MHDKGYIMGESILKTSEDRQQFEQWIKALRSGEYKQGRGALQGPQGYCCLGVACKVTIDDKLLLNIGNSGIMKGGMPRSQPHSAKWLYDVDSRIDYLFGEGLVTLNDYFLLYDFNEIADILSFFYDNDMI